MIPPHSTNRAEPKRNISLARALSKLGYCSRSQAQEIIRAGRVQVNAATTRNPSLRVDLRRDHIAVYGQQITAARKVYLMLNKPRGLITTTNDEQDRATVYECLHDRSIPWVFPVGRLDKASEGLLLFTNDTRWAAHILDPATHTEKTYHVQISRLADDLLLRRLLEGVTHKSDYLRAKRAQLLRKGTRNSWIEIVLDEGRNRHVRRMLDALDVEVLRLIRIAVGPVKLGDLKKGEYRHLTSAERMALNQK